jgi:hypothetical protein
LITCDEIRVAEANAVNFHQDFVRARVVEVGFFNAEGLTRSTRDSRGDFHVRYAIV